MSDMKILDPLDHYMDHVNKITNHVTETQDAFIFQTISDFALNNYQLVIEKEELIRAIQLIRMSREYGPDIDRRWETATQQCAELGKVYKKGYRDGAKEEHDRIMEMLRREEGCAELYKDYMIGVRDGVKEERDRIMEMSKREGGCERYDKTPAFY